MSRLKDYLIEAANVGSGGRTPPSLQDFNEGRQSARCLNCDHPTSFNPQRGRCFYCGHEGEAVAPIDPDAEREARERKTAAALRIWGQCVPIRDGDPARRYLASRAIRDLPPDPDRVLRFHPQCPWEKTTRPCLVALFSDPITDQPLAIHRTPVDCGPKPDLRMTLGGRGRGVIKLWPLTGNKLVLGEGIETVLSAATAPKLWREPLRPAWAAGAAANIGDLKRRTHFPIIDGVKRLVLLVDNDLTGTGQAAADICASAWGRAGREVIQLKPKKVGDDFNSVVRAGR